MKETQNRIDIELLEQIQQVDVPEFLYTRVQQKIQENITNTIPTWATYLVGFSFLLLVAINLSAVISYSKAQQSTSKMAKDMNLLPNNNLYGNE